MFSHFKVTKSYEKARSKVRTIVCCCKYYQNDLRYQAKALRRGPLASDDLALPLIFYDSLRWNLSKFLQFFTIYENFPADHLKSEKIAVPKAVSSLFAILCLLPLFQMWSCELFRQQALGRIKICIAVQQFLGKPDNSYSKDLCRKTLRNGIELCQDRYLSMRRLSNLSPLRKFPHGVFCFGWPLF